jgi:GT2 family glycosyltransferase
LINAKAVAGGWEATGPEPWLRVDAPASGGRWVRMVYASGLTDPLTRPALRFAGRHGAHDEFLPAAMWGRAVWIGRLPDDVEDIQVSPTLAEGAFAFRIERWDVISAARAMTYFGDRGLGRSAKYMWGRMRGWEQFARLQARRALGATPLQDYEAWRQSRARAFEPGFDRPGGAVAPVRFHILAPDDDAADALKPALDAQIWPYWRLALAGERGGIGDDDYVLKLEPGDRLEPHALAVLAQAGAREPGLDALYADEDAYEPASGRRFAPLLKPDWSPLFSRSGYAGAPLALRGAAWKAGGFDPDAARVAHVRRVLVSRREPPRVALPAAAAAPARREASLIVPTRDRLDLLRPCIDSLTQHDSGAECELIVVDNGSVQPDVLAYLEALSRQPRAQVLQRPGPFNFSALANAGAKAAQAPFLLFLNDDVEALGPGWLGRMLELAARPQVGAVGAKLTYPDGRLQHGGVVLGLDGFAGHVQRLLDADDPGYLGELAWPREVSAVTGACLALEARKFHEVGGFDEARLPVEYNDIDLCLRLAERGYGAVFEPRARLMHRESASRGANPTLDSRYAGEHSYFRERWARRLRDDGYFHPALSLDALEIALG